MDRSSAGAGWRQHAAGRNIWHLTFRHYCFSAGCRAQPLECLCHWRRGGKIFMTARQSERCTKATCLADPRGGLSVPLEHAQPSALSALLLPVVAGRPGYRRAVRQASCAASPSLSRAPRPALAGMRWWCGRRRRAALALFYKDADVSMPSHCAGLLVGMRRPPTASRGDGPEHCAVVRLCFAVHRGTNMVMEGSRQAGHLGLLRGRTPAWPHARARRTAPAGAACGAG